MTDTHNSNIYIFPKKRKKKKIPVLFRLQVSVVRFNRSQVVKQGNKTRNRDQDKVNE